MKATFSLLLIILITVNINAQSVDSSNWNYHAFPDIPFDLEHLDLQLIIEPAAGQINGVADYEIISRREQLNRIVFNTADLEIQSITSNETELEYFVSNDSLFIDLGDSLSLHKKQIIRVIWQSSSQYGIHTDASGNMWTGLNPASLHHWLPILDHPHVNITFNAEITAPAGLTTIFNGQLLKEESLSGTEIKSYWSSKNEIPVSQLSLAVGKFDKDEAISGVNKINLFSNEMILSNKEEAQLLETAVRSFKQTAQELSFEYPFESLNIVVLPDHYWNEIQYGAGIIYLYKNLGSFESQLKRSIAAQWFGSYHSYLNEISGAPKYEFLKANLLRRQQLNALENEDSMKTISAWNDQVNSLSNTESDFFMTVVHQSLNALIRSRKGVTSWKEYAEFWYEKTGYYWDQVPDFNSVSPSTDSVIKYEVEYQLNEQENRLSLHFKALNGRGIASLADVLVRQYSFGDTLSDSISFTGMDDIVDVELSGTVDYVTLHLAAGSNLIFIEQKPFLFLINQLRSTKIGERLTAAKGLITYKNHPDLQLALSDALSREKNTEVKAALIYTLGVVLNGAAGTEQTFLEQLNSEKMNIRISAAQSLSQYPEDEQVEHTLRNLILKTTSDSLFEAAIQSFGAVSGISELLQLSDLLLRVDTSGQRSLKVIRAAIKNDSTGQSFAKVDQFLKNTYPYEIRSEALQLLQSLQQEASYWEKKLPELLTDGDPRIRYSSLKSLRFLNDEKRQEWLEIREEEEYDIRVRARIITLLN